MTRTLIGDRSLGDAAAALYQLRGNGGNKLQFSSKYMYGGWFFFISCWKKKKKAWRIFHLTLTFAERPLTGARPSLTRIQRNSPYQELCVVEPNTCDTQNREIF